MGRPFSERTLQDVFGLQKASQGAFAEGASQSSGYRPGECGGAPTGPGFGAFGVSDLFDPRLVGPFPDGWVDATTVDDWQKVLDLVRAGPWRWEVDEDHLPTALELASRRDHPEAETHPVRVEVAPGAWLRL